jgi:GTP1/Obg family GTP-binding protein
LQPDPTELTMLVAIYPTWWKSSLLNCKSTENPTT